MDEYWACSAAYVYVLHLDPGSRAWEYLRRNPRYMHDWMHYRRSPSQRIAVRWGLASLVDPRFDARQVSPVWAVGDLAPVTLVREELLPAQTDLDTVGRFSLWKLAGRKSLVEEGGGTRLVLNSSVRAVQVRLGGHLGDGDRFAYQIPAVADERAAWTALTGFRALMPVSGGGSASSPERPGRSDLFHVRALQVLDGLAAGGTHRELAVALFGVRAVARDWQPDSALRAQLRYLIRRARALMEGGYRSLVDSGSALSYSGNTGGNRRKWVTDQV
ncbi:MAG: DNA -binding domain-containing protein [Steroidobacteraceae bacterium]